MLNISLNVKIDDFTCNGSRGSHNFPQHGSDEFFSERIDFK